MITYRQEEEIKYPKKRTKEDKKRATGSFLKSFGISFFIIIMFSLFIYRKDIKNFFVDILRIANNKSTARFEISLPFSAKRQNILILGVDISDSQKDPFKGVRSDSITIVSIAPYAKDVNVISVPRDSKVYHSNSSKPDKINHAFAKGGADLTVSTIEETFGIRINHYLVVSTKAMIEFVNAIGGVPVDVEKDMQYRDMTSKLRINLKKGRQILSGSEVEGYMRFRHDALGDIGRIGRQQIFYNALAKKIQEPQTLLKLPEAIKQASKYIQTDMSVYQLTQFAGLLKTMDPAQIHVATIPGAPSSRDEISYWIIAPSETQALINRLIYRDKVKPLEKPLEIGILYNSANEDKAKELQSELENRNLDVNMVKRESLIKKQISIHNVDVPIDFIYSLKKEFPQTQELPIFYDLVGFHKIGKDFTVVLGN